MEGEVCCGGVGEEGGVFPDLEGDVGDCGGVRSGVGDIDQSGEG